MMDKNEQKNVLDLFKKIKKEFKVEPVKEKEEKEKELSNLDKLELEFANLIDKVEKLEESRLMAIADNQNTVKRFQNESILVRKYGGEKIATEIIPAIDMFRSVLKSTPDNPEIKNYLMGFEMIINQMDQALANAGVSMITVNVGDDLNPEIHSAIEQVETDKVESGKIAIVVSNGYKLHDRVIKHAAVKVAK